MVEGYQTSPSVQLWAFGSGVKVPVWVWFLCTVTLRNDDRAGSDWGPPGGVAGRAGWGPCGCATRLSNAKGRLLPGGAPVGACRSGLRLVPGSSPGAPPTHGAAKCLGRDGNVHFSWARVMGWDAAGGFGGARYVCAPVQSSPAGWIGCFACYWMLSVMPICHWTRRLQMLRLLPACCTSVCMACTPVWMRAL